jgi:ribosomal protein S18 acetylase RimI-like enzyme
MAAPLGGRALEPHQLRLPDVARTPVKIDHAENWYRSRGRDTVFKMTAAAQPDGLEPALRRRGYVPTFTVSVQTRSVAAGPMHESLTLTSEPVAGWLDAKRSIAGDGDERARHLPGLLSRITAPTAYVSAPAGGPIVGVGLAVITGEHVGLYDLAVDPGHRRRGLGTHMVEALCAWAAGCGATTAHLQVETGNAPALALYRSLHFEEIYRYRYLALRTE